MFRFSDRTSPFRFFLVSGAFSALVLAAMAPDVSVGQVRERENRGRLRQRRQARMEESTPPRDSRMAMQTVRGEIKAIKRVPVRDRNVAHVVAQIETSRGDETLVDLGPSTNFRNAPLRHGDEITVQGRVARIGDFRIVVAKEIETDDRNISVSYRDQARNTARGVRDTVR